MESDYGGSSNINQDYIPKVQSFHKVMENFQNMLKDSIKDVFFVT